MKAEFTNVKANLEIIKRLATEAFQEGAELVIVPEFFTSAMGFHTKMLDVGRPLKGEPWQLLNQLAKKYNGVIGGSFMAFREKECYNTFVLAFPDGTNYYHDKDQPTMWENCWYIGGTDDGILETELGNIGAALCWEFVRTRTAKRLLNRVDIVVGGSCWWTLPERNLPGFRPELHETILEMMVETPGKFARMIGVPVVHAAHAGDFEGDTPLLKNIPYKSYYLGETQIVDGSGKILARLKHEEGEGIILEEIDFSKKWTPTEPIPDRFWIPDMPQELQQAWDMFNQHGEKYYIKKTKPYLEKQLK
jgi:predicted amidohydrolase